MPILGLVAAAVLLTTVPLVKTAQAQTYNILYKFRGGTDGYQPSAGLTLDRAGNLYGTEPFGGSRLHGSAFRLRHARNWVHTILHSFGGGNDGVGPFARIVIGPDGNLYSTTLAGGVGGCGTIFKLAMPTTARQFLVGNWTETVMYRFTNVPDGCLPGSGTIVFDENGVLYGTTNRGGVQCDPIDGGCGTVYSMIGGNVRILYRFTGGLDGSRPSSGVIVDRAGNLYGTTVYGGPYGFGTVYELSPSDTGWVEKVLYNFTNGNDGAEPGGGLIFDASGNLYGTTFYGGSGGGGTVFKLAPDGTFTVICSLVGRPGPTDSLVMDTEGNLYGTTYQGGAFGYGSVFKLTPQQDGSWLYTDLHDFGVYEGAYPKGGVILDGQGNLYGTTSSGHIEFAPHGLVYEITP